MDNFEAMASSCNALTFEFACSSSTDIFAAVVSSDEQWDCHCDLTFVTSFVYCSSCEVVDSFAVMVSSCNALTFEFACCSSMDKCVTVVSSDEQ